MAVISITIIITIFIIITIIIIYAVVVDVFCHAEMWRGVEYGGLELRQQRQKELHINHYERLWRSGGVVVVGEWWCCGCC